MESTEEGLGVTLDEFGLLQNKLTGRLEENWNWGWPGAQATFAATYKEGQRGLLRAVLEDLGALAGGGLKQDT